MRTMLADLRGRYSQFINQMKMKITKLGVEFLENYFSSRKKKNGRQTNKPKKGRGLGKNGQVYQNNLTDSDYTSQTGGVRKLK